jgi:hypothetical protein
MNRKSIVWGVTCAGSKVPTFKGNVLPSSYTLMLGVTDYSETSVTTRLRGLLLPKTAVFLVIPVRISRLQQIRIAVHVVFSYQ